MRQIKSIFLENSPVLPPNVVIKFGHASDDLEINGEGDGEDERRIPSWTCDSPYMPHKDFINAMKSLRKLALEICEITLDEDAKEWTSWGVREIKFSGDYDMKKARVVLMITHHVKATDKVIKFASPQLTLHPKDEDKVKYPHADKLAKAINEIVGHAWDYMNGKYGEDLNDNRLQLPLFEFEPVATQ